MPGAATGCLGQAADTQFNHARFAAATQKKLDGIIKKNVKIVNGVEVEFATLESRSPSRPEKNPRKADRVSVQYALRQRMPDGRWKHLQGSDGGEALSFTLGARRVWPIVETAVGMMTLRECAKFPFVADYDKLPRDCRAQRLQTLKEGDDAELELVLESFTSFEDVTRARNAAVTKRRLAGGNGAFTPRTGWRVIFSAAPVPPGFEHTATVGDAAAPPHGVASYRYELRYGEGACEPLTELLTTMALNEVALLCAPRAWMADTWPKGGPLYDVGLPPPPRGGDGNVVLWVRLDAMRRMDTFGDEGDVVKEMLNSDKDNKRHETYCCGVTASAESKYSERGEAKGELPALDEDATLCFMTTASDGDGGTLFVDERPLTIRLGDLPLAEPWAIKMLRTMYKGERSRITTRGDKAAYLVEALSELRDAARDAADGGGAADGSVTIGMGSAAAHVRGHGLEVLVEVVETRPPAPRDGVSGAQLLASAEDLKERANALFKKGYTAGAMRKYKRAMWLMQDGREKEAPPSQALVQTVGTGGGDEPRHCRFEEGQRAAVDALRISLHLNLAVGALKVSDNCGALAAAQVARKIDPAHPKALYREAQALVALRDFPAARKALSRLIELDPGNSAARKLRESVRAQQSDEDVKERQLFGGVLTKIGSEKKPLYTEEALARMEAAEAARSEAAAKAAQKEDGGKRRELESMEPADFAQMREFMLPGEWERIEHWRGKVRGDSPDGLPTAAEERAMWAEFYAIKQRVGWRKSLLEEMYAANHRLANEVQKIVAERTLPEEAKAKTVRRRALLPFETDLKPFLSADERREIDGIRGRPNLTLDAVGEIWDRLQQLFLAASERRIESIIDERAGKEPANATSNSMGEPTPAVVS